MERQIHLLNWLYNNKGSLPLETNQILEGYSQDGYEGEKSNLSEVLRKLADDGLVDKSLNGYQITGKGENKVGGGQDRSEYLSKPEGYEEYVQLLVEYFRQQIQEELYESVTSNESLEVSLEELDKFESELLEFLTEDPEAFIEALEEALGKATTEEGTPDYRLLPDVDWLEEPLAKASNSSNIGTPVIVEGAIRVRENKAVMTVSGKFRCSSCAETVEKSQDGSELKSPYKCDNCGSRKFDTEDESRVDVLDFRLEDFGANQTQLQARFLGNPDISGSQNRNLVAGASIRALVVPEAVSQKGRSKATVRLDVIDFQPKTTVSDVEEVGEDLKEEVRRKAEKADDPFEGFTNSIAPHLGGLSLAKTCYAASLIGSTPDDDDYQKGRIHSCIVSNPGMGKSELNTWVKEVFNNVHRAEGGGQSTTAGLTATVEKDSEDHWRMVAGGVVNADGGLLLIDEFDKSEKGDLASLNTAMESGTLSIDKAGVNRDIPAAATVIATGNYSDKLTVHDKPKDKLPEKGEGFYDRFALKCPIVENKEEARKAILDSKSKGHSASRNSPLFDREEARIFRHLCQNYEPKLSAEARKHFEENHMDGDFSREYADLRGTSNRPFRHLLDLAEMIARCNFKREVQPQDIKQATDLKKACEDRLGYVEDLNEIKGKGKSAV